MLIWITRHHNLLHRHCSPKFLQFQWPVFVDQNLKISRRAPAELTAWFIQRHEQVHPLANGQKSKVPIEVICQGGGVISIMQGLPCRSYICQGSSFFLGVSCYISSFSEVVTGIRATISTIAIKFCCCKKLLGKNHH